MSTLVTANISDGTDTLGTEYVVHGSAKAWAVANTAGSAITNSMNVASVTDLGSGLRTFTYTTAFSTGYTAVLVSPQSGGPLFTMYYGVLASSVNTMTEDSNTNRVDKDVSLAVRGDLA